MKVYKVMSAPLFFLQERYVQQQEGSREEHRSQIRFLLQVKWCTIYGDTGNQDIKNDLIICSMNDKIKCFERSGKNMYYNATVRTVQPSVDV